MSLRLIVSEAGQATDDEADCDQSPKLKADALALLRQRLLGIEAAAAAEIGRAEDGLAAAVSTQAAQQNKLCEEHLQKVCMHGMCTCTALQSAVAAYEQQCGCFQLVTVVDCCAFPLCVHRP